QQLQRGLAGHEPAVRHIVLPLRLVARDPDSRRRPHRLSALHRREPLGVERQLHDRARREAPAARDPRAGRPHRRRRPAPQRDGACNNRFGTLATWATDLVNLAAGRLGAVGGAMFPTPAIDIAALMPFLGDGHARWRSRVRGLPETLGDLPAATLAEEIETPG